MITVEQITNDALEFKRRVDTRLNQREASFVPPPKPVVESTMTVMAPTPFVEVVPDMEIVLTSDNSNGQPV